MTHHALVRALLGDIAAAALALALIIQLAAVIS